MFDEIDVSDWPQAGQETLGTKPKRWLEQPDAGVYWLMKDRTENRRKDGTSFPKGDDWAERVASAVAGVLGLPAAETELVVVHTGDESTYGVISRSVLTSRTDERLAHGNELLADAGFDVGAGKNRRGYTPEAVRTTLAPLDAPADVDEGTTAWDVFVGYLVLDALIGNTDRHHENWAAIVSKTGPRLAPTFDHASSLGFQLDDDRRQEALATKDELRTPEAYADRATSKFEGRLHPVDVAVEALDTLGAQERARRLDRCRDLRPLVEAVEQVPDNRMSPAAREFAIRLVQRNRSRLLSHPFGTLSS